MLANNNWCNGTKRSHITNDCFLLDKSETKQERHLAICSLG